MCEVARVFARSFGQLARETPDFGETKEPAETRNIPFELVLTEFQSLLQNVRCRARKLLKLRGYYKKAYFLLCCNSAGDGYLQCRISTVLTNLFEL